MNITFRQLQVFCEIANKGNVSRAAEATDISQSAASMALSELEKQIGEQLFDRFGRKLTLNSNGRTLLPKALEILARVDEIEKTFHKNSSQFSGEIHLGASSTIGNYVMPSIMGQFSTVHPEVDVSLMVGNTEQIIEALKNCEIDIGYIEGLCNDPQIKTTIWKQDELVVFASPQNPLTSREPDLKDLENSNWILREKGSGTRDIFERAITDKIENLKIRYELGHTEAVKNGVKHNLGISCLSRRTVEENLKNQTLSELPTPYLQLKRNFYLLIREDKYQTRTLQKFIHFANGDGT